MRLLVTGADGFVGRHLTAHLRASGDQVVEAVGLEGSAGEHLDVRDAARVRAVVEAARPDAVIHLAAVSSVAVSHEDPASTLAVNVLGSANVLSAVRAVAKNARVLLVGSGEVYGPTPAGERADETWPLLPVSPYGASKAAVELLGAQFARSYGLQVMASRAFNHLGAGQAPKFLVPDVARQIARMKRGASSTPRKLELGNIEVVRDFSHVTDVVRAYRHLVEFGVSGEAYNVCSGVGRTVRSVIERMLALAEVDAEIEIKAERMRPAELPSLVGSPEKLEALGWKAERTTDDALGDALAEAERSITLG